MRFLTIILSLFLLIPLYAQKDGNVGMVKRLKVTLPGELLMAAKVDDKDEAMVRIISTEKSADGFTYDLEFIGLEPGKYNLINYLRTASKDEPVNLPEYSVEVNTSLTESFDGALVDFQKNLETMTPWYKNLNRILIILWIILLPAIIFFGRKRKIEEIVLDVKEKTLNEKICDLLKSLEGNSTKELWQKIEGLIFQHWCKEKELEGMPMHKAIAKLKEDAEAGPFILKLEEGLHSKMSRDENRVAELIKNLTNGGHR